MSEIERPQTYLITPPELDLESFPTLLASVLDTQDVACVRIALSTQDENQIIKACDALRDVTSPRDIALVIASHVRMVEKLGLDGVHLVDGARSVRKVREELGKDAIVGAYCAGSRHDGLNAGEAGADYISFGPVGQSPLGDGETAEIDLFKWWSEVVEIPVVAEGGLDEENLATLSSISDFVAFGPEIWNADDPSERLKSLVACLG
ncbi:MAG: thiamine phosphate synthase [Marinosulfonomonas sp.]|nr:MAG: thiamine phosphate synthase [Marinosulfonomonas sp.]